MVRVQLTTKCSYKSNVYQAYDMKLWSIASLKNYILLSFKNLFYLHEQK